MAIWVCRTGLDGQYENNFFNNNVICLTREGFDFNLADAEKREVIECLEKLYPDAAKQTISNTWSQINIFVNKMSINDLVIIPKKGTFEVSVAKISSDYCYNERQEFPLQHQRTIKVLAKNIDTTVFPQDIRYSLGAFRTIFGIRQENRLIDELKKMGVKLYEI